MSVYVPRVSAGMLSQFTNQYVRIIGKVIELNPSEGVAQIEASGVVTAQLSTSDPLELGNVYDFAARVIGDDVIKLSSSAYLNTDEYDSDLIERVIAAHHRYPQIFLSSKQEAF